MPKKDDLLNDINTLEQRREWRNLLIIAYKAKLMNSKEKTQAMRGHAYLAEYTEVENINLELESNIDHQSKIRKHLALSTMYRRQGKLSAAVVSVNKAFLLSKKEMDDFLFAEASYERALVLCESGQLFESLGLFQKISSMKDVTGELRRISSLNQGLLLWDLGQHFHLKKLIKDKKRIFPKEYLLRMNILISMSEMKHKKLLKLFNHKMIESLNDYQKTNLAFLFLEWFIVSNKDFFEIKNFHLSKYISNLNKDHPHYNLKRIFDSIIDRSKAVSTEFINGCSWRDQIDYLFLISLTCYKNGVANDFYNKLLLISEKECICTPLMPRSNDEATTKWQKFISQHVLNEHVIMSNNSCSTLFYNSQQLYCLDDRILSVKRRPIVQKLIELLIKEGNRPISKEKIHKALTGNKYSKSLHDDRIYKVVSRFNRLVKDHFGIIFFEKRRDNFIYPLISIEVRNA